MSTNPTIPQLTMTPELERILARGRNIHPTMPDGFSGDMLTYNEQMDLPSLDDKHGILRWMGLNDDVIDWILDQYQGEFASDPEDLVVGVTVIDGDETREGRRFPLLDRLWNLLKTRETETLWVDEDYDGYVGGGLAEGLRPEFAIFCGLHPSEEDYSREVFREYFYVRSYQEQADIIVGGWRAALEILWKQKLEIEDAKRQSEAELDDRDVNNEDRYGQRVDQEVGGKEDEVTPEGI
ncbi:hypothetical protein GGR54DRAFT_609466 [Hypoxylon sp. NC1633]|nr:hypothetical protein GGR54DRAFT_609466 [Hypoxylon sp. NC1633]